MLKSFNLVHFVSAEENTCSYCINIVISTVVAVHTNGVRFKPLPHFSAPHTPVIPPHVIATTYLLKQTSWLSYLLQT